MGGMGGSEVNEGEGEGEGGGEGVARQWALGEGRGGGSRGLTVGDSDWGAVTAPTDRQSTTATGGQWPALF